MDKNNNLPLSDEQQEQQQLPVGDTQPFENTGGEDRTIAFVAGSSQEASDLVDDILAEEMPAQWEEETVAVQVSEPEQDSFEPEEEQQPEEQPDENVMPPVKPRNPFRRVPKRV